MNVRFVIEIVLLQGGDRSNLKLVYFHQYLLYATLEKSPSDSWVFGSLGKF